VSKRVDGMPHRVLRTGLVEKLESGSRARGFTAAILNAQKFKKMSGMTWRSMIRDGLAMRHGKELTWSQVVMAANTPMLLKAGLVEGNTEAGVLASGLGVALSIAYSIDVTMVLGGLCYLLLLLPALQLLKLSESPAAAGIDAEWSALPDRKLLDQST